MENKLIYQKAAKELRNLKFQGGQITILMDQTRIDEAEGALENVYFAQYPEAKKEFQSAYKKEFEQKPGITSDTAYDAVKLIAASIQKSETINPEKVQKVMRGLKLNGASGDIIFDKNGGVVRSPDVWQLVDGSYKLAKLP